MKATDKNRRIQLNEMGKPRGQDGAPPGYNGPTGDDPEYHKPLQTGPGTSLEPEKPKEAPKKKEATLSQDIQEEIAFDIGIKFDMRDVEITSVRGTEGGERVLQFNSPDGDGQVVLYPNGKVQGPDGKTLSDHHNRTPSGFDRFKKTLDGMKAQAQAQQQKTVINKPMNIDSISQTIRQEVRPIKRKSPPTPGGMNFEQMIGIEGSSQGNFDDMLSGTKKKGKKSKRSSSRGNFDDMLGMGPRKKDKKKKTNRTAWDDMMNGGMF